MRMQVDEIMFISSLSSKSFNVIFLLKYFSSFCVSLDERTFMFNAKERYI